METSFQHEDIPLGHIRLLQLHGLDHDLTPESHETLRGEICIVPLNEALKYKALSYVWGDPSFTEELRFTKGSLRITANLSAALHELASLCDQLLWVDQLCINQSDLAERSQQVNIMGSIFQSAEEVLLWLGPDTQGYAAAAVSFIQEIGLRWARPFSGGISVTDQSLTDDNLPGITSIKWTALNSFLQSPYFGRAWILQEVMLASSKTLLWGSQRIAWMDFERLLVWLLDSEGLSDDETPVDRDALVRAHQVTHCTPSFLKLLIMTTTRTATDERDKVFALLGLFDHSSEPLLADYTMSVIDVFRNAALYIMRRDQVFQVLSSVHCDSENGPDVDEGWPSWVPRWHAGGPMSLTGDGCGICASADIPFDIETLPVSGSNVVTFADVECGEVRQLGTVNQGGSRGSTMVQFHQIWEAWTMLSQNTVVPPSTSPTIQALLLTFLWAGAATADSTKVLQWDDSLYLQFAAVWATTLFHLVPSSAEGSSPCLRHRLDLSAAAILAEQGLCAHSAEERNRRLAPIMTKRVVEIIDFVIDTVEDHNWKGILLQLRHMLDELHSDAIAVEAGVQLLIFYFSMELKNHQLMAHVMYTYSNRRFFVTNDGRMGLGPIAIKKNDIVAVLLGSPVPHILRPTGEQYLFIGECYVDGIMKGEIVDDLRKRGELERETRQFELV